MKLVTIGDVLLDVIMRLGEVLEDGADASAKTITSAGGQAGNVAAWAVALGAEDDTMILRRETAAQVSIGSEKRRVVGTELLQQLGRAFDIEEEKRDRACRQGRAVCRGHREPILRR